VRCGAYEIVAPISKGAMGAVYRARHVETGQEVALKQLIELAEMRRFEIEARLLASLDHPRVVRVLDHFEHRGRPFLVMVLVDGPDLAQVLADRGDPGLPVGEAVEYARQACEALAYIHAQHVIHRDVKPDNLILGDGGVVLVDFGVAREHRAAGGRGTVAIGTPGYMAPEVFGGEISPRADVFGIAATLWTLISGEPPQYGDVARLDVEPRLQAALHAGLELDPNRRTASAEAFAAAIGVRLAPDVGAPLAVTVEEPGAPATLMEAVVRAAAGVFDAGAASLALLDPLTGELVYEAAWGPGASHVLGLRIGPGVGLAGAVAASGEGEAVPDCRNDPRFATSVAVATGYMPSTMIVVPLRRGGRTAGVLQVLDRRDGEGYGPKDVERAAAFADLALMAVDVQRGGRDTVAP
jgi:tRNA A-37 threonylcarbamoyl transferase component Bud32/putative methionine-R-sulfoxide reductase with GAF domain